MIDLQLAVRLRHASAVAFTCDGWTSTATKGYLDITGHWLTEDFNMQSVVLRIRRMTAHTGEVLISFVIWY